MGTIPHPHSQQSAFITTLYVLLLPVFPTFTRVKNMLLWEHRLRYFWLSSPRRLAVKKSGKSLPKSLKMRLIHQIGLSNSVFQDSLSCRNLLLPSECLHGRLQVWTGKFFLLAVVIATQMTSERKFLELHSVQRQTHRVYEPAVGKHTKTPNPALGRAPREEQGSQRCFEWGTNLSRTRVGCCAVPRVGRGLRLGLPQWQRALPCSSQASLNPTASVLGLAPYPEQRKRLPLSSSPLLQFPHKKSKIQERKHWSKINYH